MLIRKVFGSDCINASGHVGLVSYLCGLHIHVHHYMSCMHIARSPLDTNAHTGIVNLILS